MDDYSDPLKVQNLGGSVIIKGPGRVEGAFTAEAAERSGVLLIQAAMKAREHDDRAPIPFPRQP